MTDQAKFQFEESVVLLIEDNVADACLIAELLSEQTNGFCLVTERSLAAGLERLQKGDIMLILTDLRLPDSAQSHTVMALHAAAPAIPIVVLSGLEDEELALRTLKCGAQDYLVKGRIDHCTLLRTLRYALERHALSLDLRRAHDELESRVEERTAELGDIALRLDEALSQLQLAQRRIVQQERLRALGQMASGIAHDFNNALAPILCYSDLLLHSDRVTPENKIGYLRIIHTAAKDSSNVVSRLREFFRYRDEHDVFGPVKLDDLVQQAMDLTRPRWRDQALGRGVEIQFSLDLQRVPTVLGSESELREMLVNLIFNAADAIATGARAGTIFCRTLSRNGSAVLQVVDTGCGMPEEVRMRCFEPFFSTKGELHGSGLGLSMVHGIVRRHEGGIEIDSTPGQGTTVTISLLPYEDAPQTEVVVKGAESVNPLRVLVVDDEPSVREVLSICLWEDGHTVETAANGMEALGKIRSGELDIILTDRAMPGMNGDEFAAEARKIVPDLPIILVTGFADLMGDVGDRPEAIDVVVRKPFTLATIRAGIAKALGIAEQRKATKQQEPEQKDQKDSEPSTAPIAEADPN